MKYNSEIIKEICNYIKAGNSQADSAALCDISEKTFYEWMKKSKFCKAIKKAEFECKSRNIAIIQRSGAGRKGKRSITRPDGTVIQEEYDIEKPNWFAAAWWLERKFKDEFAQRLQQEHSGLKFDKASEEELEEALAHLNETDKRDHKQIKDTDKGSKKAS
jgi:hypothetical protein